MPYERTGRCPMCDSLGLCAADCSNAPWNFEGDKGLAKSPFLYLLRQRRWCRSPVPRDAIFFRDRSVVVDWMVYR